ncbi:hypothetical protein J2X92_004179 [Variovorax paradoxus]|nr:hypothetical protein [Variovorax paradoxus]
MTLVFLPPLPGEGRGGGTTAFTLAQRSLGAGGPPPPPPPGGGAE